MKKVLLAGLVLSAACAPLTPPRSVDDSIMGELDKAAAQKPGARPAAVDEALLPPLRMEMPPVAGRPIEPRFDLSVHAAPAVQVFMSLVSGTRYSMLVHPEVSGTVSVTLKDVTLREALESFRDLYGYDYRIEGSRISILPAGLQTRVFRVNYLTGMRRGTSEVRVQSGSVADVTQPPGTPGQTPTAVPVPGALQAGQNLPAARSIDSSRIATQQTNDFWSELRESLQAIVGGAPGRSVVITPHSGVVVVRAMPAELRGVEQYLRETRLSVERQVMLEAKIIEVTLSDAYQAGINWASFRVGTDRDYAFGQFGTGDGGTRLGARGQTMQSGALLTDTAGKTVIASGTTGPGSNPAGAVFGLALQTANFAALIQFLESQGNVQVLSSPRVATLNNQKAVLKVGTDEFFVTNVSTVTTTTGTTTQQTPTVTVAPFFSGILLDVTPQVDDNGNIMLHIHPSISEVTESRRVVALGGGIAPIVLPLARSTVSETDTIVRVTDGNIVAIGGLMSYDLRDARGGIPGLSGVPLISNADRRNTKRELVILLKPTVLGEDRVWAEDLRQTQERIRNLYPRKP